MKLARILAVAMAVPLSALAETVWTEALDLTLEGKAGADTVHPYDRLPRSAEGKVPKGVWKYGRHSTGLAVRFVTDATNVSVRCIIDSAEPPYAFSSRASVLGCDVYGKVPDGYRFICDIAPYRPFSGEEMTNSMTFAWRPGREGLVYLPLRASVKSLAIGVERGFAVSKAPVRASGVAKPVVHYGTSIVHGGNASRPGMAFPAIEGRLADVPVVNLGFSGSGRCEIALAEVLAGVDASLYVVDCVWNLQPNQLTKRLEPFVRELHRRRPCVPILLAAGCSTDLTDRTDACGHPLLEDNAIVKGVCDRLRAESEDFARTLHYLPSEGMLPQDGDATCDHCHPNDYGCMQMGRAYAQKIREILRQ